jgi:Regulator of chromosome condensation (RCC1) repeat
MTTRRTARAVATAVATSVIGGMLALSAPSAGATTTSGAVSAWGSTTVGQTNVPAAAQSDVTAIAAGDDSGYAVKTDGSVIGWGSNSLGQTTIPAAAQSGVVAIDAGGYAVAALKADGSVVSWGNVAPAPTGLTGVTQVAVANSSGMALKSDHTIQTWPGNQFLPASVQGHVVGIDSSYGTSVALTDTGSVVTWAPNGVTAVPDAAKSGVVKVRTSDANVAAVKSDGSVVTWGVTDLGPTPAAAMSGVVDVALGSDFAVALKSDGTLVTWGPGQQNIPGLATFGVTSVAAGGYFAMTLHQPSSAPTITGTPTPAVQGTPYDFGLTVGGTPAPTSVQVAPGTLPVGLGMDNTGHLTGTPAKAGRTTVTVTATSSVGSIRVPVTITVQPGHSTNLQFIDPPPSVATGALESDQHVRSFAERYNQTLASNLTVGGTTIPAGTKVNVYYLHADHVGSDNVANTLTGSEWFGTKVLATATNSADLQATAPLFKAPTTTYPTDSDQGLEFDDSVTKYVDQTGINYTLNSYTASDDVRIITLAP